MYEGQTSRLLKLSGKDIQMQVARFSLVFLGLVSVIVLNGCVAGSQYEDLQVKNLAQQERLDRLDSEFATANLKNEQLTRQLAAIQGRSGAETSSLRAEVAALEDGIEQKNRLIASLQGRLLGGVALPVELSTQLQDFANSTEMVTFDPSSGVVRFKSDLLFEPGSARVAPSAAKTVKSLCGILNSKQAKEFDVIIAGHTDDMRIGRPATRAKHPTNWHLSVHRAISVLEIMAGNKVVSKRISVRGFGEFRPVAPNKPNKGGSAKNRRVEIYIVPAGM